jgi:uncharacterized membrane protein
LTFAAGVLDRLLPSVQIMFDVISGLPVHPLVVHAVVVLLPLMAVVTVLVTARAPWRGALRWVVVADALVLVSAVVADQSGEALQGRLSQVSQAGEKVAEDHGELGGTIPVVALVLLLTAVLAWFATRKGGVLVPVSIVAVSLAAIASIGLVVAVGHSWAKASWEQKIAGTHAPVGEAEDD